MNIRDYVERLRDRYNNPSHPHLGESIELLDGVDEVNKAWSLLTNSELLPDHFSNAPNRRFAIELAGDTVWPTSRPPVKRDPSSIAAVMTVGSNPLGFVDAENHARELVRRLTPWQCVCDDQLVWYFTDNPYEVSYLGRPFESARDSVEFAFEKYGLDPLDLLPAEDSLPMLVRRTLGAWQGWNEAVRCGYEFSEPGWIDHSKWQYFSDLENPFEPLLELWCTGYRLISAFEEKDPTIRLYAKPVAVGEAVRQ